MQQFMFLKDDTECVVQLPPTDTELLPGVRWGHPCALFTPAYWFTQHLMSSRESNSSRHRIGQTFLEEITACILGGYGIPAEVGLAAFEHLRKEGVISSLCTDQRLLECRLQEPIQLDGRTITYRFWRQKATYLAAAYRAMQERDFSTDEPVALRNALMTLPGVGPKTASWIVRNWLGSDEVAILDIHIVRAGILAGLFEPDEDVSKNYIRMETKFIAFSRALGVQTSDLDALIWRMMRTTPRLVMHLIELNSSLQLRCPLGPEQR